MYITYTTAVHMSHQGLSETSVVAHTTSWRRFFVHGAARTIAKEKSHVHEVITFFPDKIFQCLLQIIECLTQAHTDSMLTQLQEPIVKSRFPV